MKVSKILAASIVVACLVTTSVFAADGSTNNTKEGGQKNKITMSSKKIKNNTEKQGNMNLKKGKKDARYDNKNPMESLVTAGTITQAQSDAINEAMKTGRDSQKTMKETLDTLVTAGTITQAQEDAVLAACPKDEVRGGPGEEYKNPMKNLVTDGAMTQVQLDAINGSIKSGLDALVAAGTITQDQEDKFLSFFNK